MRKPKKYDDLLAKMVKLEDQKSVFPTYKDALIFAACLGLRRQKRVCFEKSSEPINSQIFSSNFDQMVIDVIAITAEDGDPMIMANERSDVRTKIFEEYACGGLEIIDNEIYQSSLSFEGGLIKLVLDEQKDENILDEITNLADI